MDIDHPLLGIMRDPQVAPKHRIRAYEALTARHHGRVRHMIMWVIIFCIVGYTCGCVPKARPLTPAQQSDLAVEVTSYCGRGSGVIVSPTQVVTATHVLYQTPVNPERVPATFSVHCDTYKVIRADGSVVYMRPQVVTDRDVTRLVAVAGHFHRVPDVKVGRVGVYACFFAARPSRESGCGWVLHDTGDGWGLTMTQRVRPGNSGSGLWSGGRLIGIITCRNLATERGCASSLWGVLQ